MGGQVALCLPKQDLILISNADTQGHPLAYSPIVDAFYTEIARNMHDAPLPENKEAEAALSRSLANKQLFALSGETSSPFIPKING
jgi:hypothetical protein